MSMNDNTESKGGKWIRIIIGVGALTLGVASIINGEAYPLSTTIVSEQTQYNGLFARIYGGFLAFCGLCAIFNWTQFGDDGDL